MNRLSAIRRPSFSGHESFPFRHGWLKKGLDAIEDDPKFFSRKDALVELGVGKNMVRSVRHWLLTLGLAATLEDPSHLRATALGRNLLSETGWDPYLEDDGTLWLLHYRLVTSQEAATTWWWSFHRPQTVTFRREQLVNELMAVAEENNWRTTRGTVKRDVDCFVRTYLPVATGRSTPEDAYAAPLTALGLIQPTLDKDEYILSSGWQPSLPDGIFLWGLSLFVDRLPAARGAARTVSLAQLLFDDGSPGRVFRMGEEALVDRLSRVADLTLGAWDYDETAGLQQLLVKQELSPAGRLNAYFAPVPQPFTVVRSA